MRPSMQGVESSSIAAFVNEVIKPRFRFRKL
jgi:hypothetical protein